jgi:hypothetical protein
VDRVGVYEDCVTETQTAVLTKKALGAPPQNPANRLRPHLQIAPRTDQC